jgi:hypothetical protein
LLFSLEGCTLIIPESFASSSRDWFAGSCSRKKIWNSKNKKNLNNGIDAKRTAKSNKINEKERDFKDSVLLD